MISFNRVRYSYASSGVAISGSLTISINGTPERILDSPEARQVYLGEGFRL